MRIEDNVNELLKSIRCRSQQLTEEERQEMERHEKQKEVQEYDRRIRQANIPKRFSNATFEKLERRGIPEEIAGHYALAKGYALDFENNKKNGAGLIFSGSVGRMKTTMAVAVLHEVLRQKYSGFFISMPELMDTMLMLSKADRGEFKRFQDKITTCSLLVLDDMGAEYSTDWVLNKVDAIITHRYNGLLPVIITTNLKRSEMQERYMQRIYDRLRSTSLLLVDGGKSLRSTVKK